MKRTHLFLIGILCLIAACKKEALPDKPHAAMRVAPVTLAATVSVSPYGFLVLPDSNAYGDYVDFLDSNNVQDITAFHAAIGFVSQATVPGQADNYFTPSVHNVEHLFDQHGMVQVGATLYRSVNNDGYFLAMPAANLTPATYAALTAKQFDPAVMCRIQMGIHPGSIDAFVNNNIGYDGGTTNPPVPPVVCATHVRHTYSAGGVTIIDDSWYFLGFRYKQVLTIIIEKR